MRPKQETDSPNIDGPNRIIYAKRSKYEVIKSALKRGEKKANMIQMKYFLISRVMQD